MDRTLRAVLAFALLAIGWMLQDPSVVWMRVVGLYPLVTAVIGWCPIYALLRFDSTRGRSQD